MTTQAGQTVTVNLAAEEVENLLAAGAVVTFEAAWLELVGVLANQEFLAARGGTVVLPDPEIDNAGGRVDLSMGVADGEQAGVGGTGVLAGLEFRAQRAGVVNRSAGAGSAMRDPDNRPIELQLAGGRVVVA